MDSIYFLARYTPFWAIPLALLGGEFAYLFWVRKKKKWVLFNLIISLLALFCVISYWILGGPEKTVQFLIKTVRYYTY